MKLLKHLIFGKIINYSGRIAVWKMNYSPASLGNQGSADPRLFQPWYVLQALWYVHEFSLFSYTIV